MQVTGDFQREIDGTDWNFACAPELTKTDHPNGMLYTFSIDHLPDGFYQYKYFVTYEDGTSRWCGNPYAKYVATEHENAAFVIGGNTTDIEPIDKQIPFHGLIIYETTHPSPVALPAPVTSRNWPTITAAPSSLSSMFVNTDRTPIRSTEFVSTTLRDSIARASLIGALQN